MFFRIGITAPERLQVFFVEGGSQVLHSQKSMSRSLTKRAQAIFALSERVSDPERRGVIIHSGLATYPEYSRRAADRYSGAQASKFPTPARKRISRVPSSQTSI